MQPLRLTVTRSRSGVPTLKVEGELDLYTARDFEEQLLGLAGSESRGLIVDLSRASFVDSTACRALLHAAKTLTAAGSRLVVVNRDPEVQRILEIMGLDEFLDIVASAETAEGLAATV